VSGVLSELQDFYRDKLAALLRHEAGARLIGQYDVNNTYQYIVNREETQLSWIATAIVELGGSLPEVAPPQRTANVRDVAIAKGVVDEDAREAQAFVDRWRPRVAALPNARHAKMLNVVLGEVLEQ